MSSLRSAGANPSRTAARQYSPPPPPQPPRSTRAEPPFSKRSSHHCQTLPCMSYSPTLFGAYDPTLVVRPRNGPLSALPNGEPPWKVASFEDRLFVGLVK